MKRLGVIIAITVVWLARILTPNPGAQDQGQSNQPKLDLNGKWKTDRGDEVRVTRSGGHVKASVVKGAECGRDYYLDGDLQANSLRGTLKLCTSNKKLLDDCHLTDPDIVNFEATVDRNIITGKYQSDYINYDVRGGNYVNCRTTVGGGGPTDFSLTRICDPDKGQGCEAIGRALHTIVAAEQPVGSAGLYQQLQQNLGSQFDQLRPDLCGDPTAQNLLDDLRKNLDSLNYVPGDNRQSLQNNLLLREIEDGLRQLDHAVCHVTPPSHDQPCGPGEKKVEPQDKQAARFAWEKFKEAYDTVQEKIKEIQDHGDRVPQLLSDQLKSLKQAIEFWQNIQNAACINPNIFQRMQAVTRDRRASNFSNECPGFCSALTDWYEKLITPMPGSQAIHDGMVKAFRDDCLARCE